MRGKTQPPPPVMSGPPAISRAAPQRVDIMRSQRRAGSQCTPASAMAELRIIEHSAYHGVFAPNHHLRAAIVPAGATAAADPSRPASRRRLDWASLLKRVFATDVLVCNTCGGAMRILAILPEGDASRSILEHLGLPTEPPPPRAVGPPEPVFDDA